MQNGQKTAMAMDAPKDPSPDDAPAEIRAEIAQRLHDDVSQILSATAYLAAILKKELEARAAPEAGRAGEVCAAIRNASDKVRDLMIELQKPRD